MNAVLLADDFYQGFPRTARQQTWQISIIDTELRTLNSAPIALIRPGPTQIVIPLFLVEFIAPGTAPFSNQLLLDVAINASASLGSATLPTAVSGIASVATPMYQGVFGSTFGSDYSSFGVIGAPLFLRASSDETGGDGTVLTLTITVLIADTSGLV